MDFAGKLAIFLIMNTALGSAAWLVGRRLGGSRWTDAALGAVVVFFASVVLIGATLGFSGHIDVPYFFALSLSLSFIAVIAYRKSAAAGIDEPLHFPELPWRPLPVGFFLS